MIIACYLALYPGSLSPPPREYDTTCYHVHSLIYPPHFIDIIHVVIKLIARINEVIGYYLQHTYPVVRVLLY